MLLILALRWHRSQPKSSRSGYLTRSPFIIRYHLVPTLFTSAAFDAAVQPVMYGKVWGWLELRDLEA